MGTGGDAQEWRFQQPSLIYNRPHGIAIEHP